MAKLINGLLGNSRNKVGNIVTYVSKGQQIARAKAANIANPRTASQMGQRVRLSNLVAVYRANKAWMSRYAFENKKTSWSVYNAFVSKNIGTSLVALTKSEAASGAAVVAPYRFTDGTLPEIHVNVNAVSGIFETDLFVGSLELSSSTTIGELSQALIENNNGIVNGMQLSLVENFQSVQNNVPRITTRAYELIIDTTSTAFVSSRISAAAFVTGGTAGSLVLAYNGQASGAAQGFLFVLSHTVAGKTYVGTSVMTLADTTTYNSYITDAAIDNAIASYGSSDEIPFLDSTDASAPTEGSVSLTPSILGARLGSGSYVAPGGYLGKTPNDASIRLYAKLSNDEWGAPSDIRATTSRGNTASVQAESIQSDGNGVYSILLIDGPGRDEYIVVVTLEWTDGATIRADFTDFDEGQTE